MKSTIAPVLFSMMLLIPAANATTITFGTGGTTGFTGGATTPVNNAAGVTGLTVTITPGTTTTCSPTCTINSNGNGYGVTNGTNDNSDAIDGSGRLDTLTISFNQAVTLTGITFGSWDATDDAGIYNSTTLVTTYTATGATATVNTSGTSFQIRAVDANDDFRLRSIAFTVNTPEPATFGMLGIALLGLGLGGRRRMKRG